MHSRIQEWVQHPVSEIFIRVLDEKIEATLEELLSTKDREERERLVERLRVIKEVRDFENLMLGELE